MANQISGPNDGDVDKSKDSLTSSSLDRLISSILLRSKIEFSVLAFATIGMMILYFFIRTPLITGLCLGSIICATYQFVHLKELTKSDNDPAMIMEAYEARSIILRILIFTSVAIVLFYCLAKTASLVLGISLVILITSSVLYCLDLIFLYEINATIIRK